MPRVHTSARAAVVLALLLFAAPARAQPADEAAAKEPRETSTRLRFLLGTEAVLHSLDMATTVYALQLDGTAREANPLLAPFSQRPAALVAISGAVNALQLYTISKLHRRHPKLATAWAAILIGFEAFVVTHNLRGIGELRTTGAGRR